MTDPDLGGLGPFPWKVCPRCDKNWPLACFKDTELCFRCRNAQAQP